MRSAIRSVLAPLALATTLSVWAGGAQAIPALQLYIEGSVYDEATKTWLIETDFRSPLRLWTIANTGTVGTLYDAKLSVAYASGTSPSLSFSPTTTGGLGGFTDSSIASMPTLVQTSTDGSAPTMGNGASLPSHGEYGAGTWWQEFALGDFNLIDSPVADFIDSFPDPTTQMGQISVYEILVSGVEYLHFDIYGHYLTRSGVYKYKFAPFSHDAGTSVDEPAPLALIGLGLLALGIAQLIRRREDQ